MWSFLMTAPENQGMNLRLRPLHPFPGNQDSGIRVLLAMGGAKWLSRLRFQTYLGYSDLRNLDCELVG
jgi:hypothetical protein